MGIRIQPRDIEVPKDDPFRDDLLDRREAVDTLTHLVGNIEGPCVLAVDAPWGAGKTTFLRIWAQHLRNEDFPVVEFNAWETDFSEDPFLTLSSELTEGLQSEGTKLPGKTIKNLKDASLEVLRWVVPGAIRVAASFIPVAGSEIGQTTASFAEDRLSQHQEARTSVKKFRHVLQGAAEALSKERDGRPLILMIDELDRCRPSYAVELLEVAKHLFSVDRIVFVLAVNRDQLAHSVRALYGSGFDADGYLHRFIDLDFRLPEPNREAFIRTQLQATGIDDYFDQAPKKTSHSYPALFPDEVARKASAARENLRAMLLAFFGASDLSLRTIGQAIHRLGLLYASLRRDQHDHALPTTVALILRTLDQDLYRRFVNGEDSDLDVVDAVFSRPGLQALRHEQWGAQFEVAIVLAALEDEIPSLSMSGTPCSPLLNRYRSWKPTDRELSDAKREHATHVVDMVTESIRMPRGSIGFSQVVLRLELLTATRRAAGFLDRQFLEVHERRDVLSGDQRVVLGEHLPGLVLLRREGRR